MTETGWLQWGENPYTEERIRDQKLQELIGKTEVVVRDTGIHTQADVEIKLTDGRVFSKVVYYPKGYPNNPMTTEEIKQKFRNLASYKIKKNRCEEIIEIVDKLDKLDDVSKLADKLRQG